ncbi:MAG: OmpA family protein [Psychromonas sp.]|nr:OmpA family protein [Psychromonas sp.]
MIVLFLILNWTHIANADNKSYQAKIDNSLWYNSKSSPIECKLEHPIPRYGEASFKAVASKKINLSFFLQAKQGFPKTRLVTLKSIPPIWNPGSESIKIANIKFHQQFNGYVTNQNAWRMLNELESGMFPTFYYKSWYNNEQVTSVGLSAINFSKSYNKFNNCLAQLLPYNFKDISYSILKYDNKGLNLTTFSKKRLKMISDYIKHDKYISVILVSGYSDSYGSASENQEKSTQRADSVKKYLSKLGLSNDKITIASHGEKRHIADNRTKLGRIQNRRVIISLEREEI